VPAAAQGSRAVFFIETYRAGTGEIAVGRNGAILIIDGDQLRDIETGAALGSITQLDTLMTMESRAVDRPALAPPVSSDSSILIAAGVAAAGSALIALGLILRRIKPSKT
jgi:hypothetical protein